MNIPNFVVTGGGGSTTVGSVVDCVFPGDCYMGVGVDWDGGGVGGGGGFGGAVITARYEFL